ncbi:GH36-type glycosyl hydrolase domain-containing protein [Paenibacillus sp.]|uniref:GH36-type glycosyl hydrolase domain-containing protein n=1 Tax=Paenibacillus sp. TaxID=58172 RepID=UPI002D2EB524|nr:glucoamylase family protein [Paenibacillus sp.]HZG84200.1 glucoamylase family protein [Paenibacillus sp.]
MFLNDEQMRQESHKLALQHDPFMKRTSSARLWKNIEADMDRLRDFVKTLHEDRGTCTQPAEEWLLDHAEFLEAEALSIKEERSSSLLKTLPYISKEGRLRVSSICSDYLEHTDGLWNEETFAAYVNAYQEVSVLTIAEAWSLPLFLKIEIIRRLAALMETVRERRAICRLVDRVLAGIKPSELTAERLKEALEDAGQQMPLSGAMTVHLVQHLREHAEDMANVGEWLVCKLENGPDSLDSILSYEFQLQAAYQVTTGNLMGSLRKLSRFQGRELFERVCLVEHTLRGEKAGDYPRMDDGSRDTLRRRVEKLARRMRVPENLAATQAVQLANAAFDAEADRSGLRSRRTNAAYYLLEADGIAELREALRLCGKTGRLPENRLMRRPARTYFQLLGSAFAVVLAVFGLWIGAGEGWTPIVWAAALLALALPAAEWAVAAAHWLIERAKKPVRLLRYDFSRGVPEEAATMVVIPVIWSSIEEVKALAERLELHYLANRDPNIHFAILSDFKDADAEELPQDRLVLQAAKAEIERLNRSYPETTFHLFHRRRTWNEVEGVWMGWERKRGKLVEFAELLKGGQDTSYAVTYGDAAVLPRIRYVITLDADTQLPLESAKRMIGAMHLPYNRPRLNEAGTRVVEGYGVLQPRIGMSHESVQRSRLAALWSGDPGVDPYAYAVSDPYQDAVGQGIFTGKGIFDVDAFQATLRDAFPDNRVLSHDLLEGGFLRAGLLSDIELIDDHPATFRAHQKRLHRWVRGDWQLLPWLRAKGRNRKGEVARIDLSALTRWQIVDNLRRSLMPPVLTAILLLAPALPGSALRWYAVAFAALALPIVRQCLAPAAIWHRPRCLGVAVGHAAVALLTLPYQAVLMLDAILRTLHRLFVSKRRLLEWVSQAEVERSGGAGAPLVGVGGGAALAVATALAAVAWGDAPAVWAIGLALAAVWLAAPLVVRWLDEAPRRESAAFAGAEADDMRALAKDIWRFYEDYVTAQDSWLPPDNVQFDPPNGIAHRTSPTNIGLYMTCAVAARDLGFIDTAGLIERLERTTETIERMEKWEGHLYNWYDTETLAPLHPVYVSTVDSGNFVACLMAVREGLLEWLQAETAGEGPAGTPEGRRDDDRFQVAFAEEIAPGGATAVAEPPAPGDPAERAEPAASSRGGTAAGAGGGRGDVAERGRRLAARLEALVRGTDFRPLFDAKSNLFSLGYHVMRQERDTVLYDLMASEARQASFVAIALGQVSVSHWNTLGRTMTTAGGKPLLLSWSGTMFEYLMPWLLMRTYRNTVWDTTYRAVVGRQIEYARQRGVPFGISESGYYAFDHQYNYQYRAFGVPGLGFKRGLEEDLVLAPYATVMALPFAKREGLQALRRMEELGARGEYGYYEAIDFTPKRMPEGKRCMVIKSFMAHHQGMSLLTLSNLLLPRTMIDRFHRSKEVRAAELLLQERLPMKPALIKHPAMRRLHEPHERLAPDPEEVREFSTPHTRTPEMCTLSNGKFTTVVTAAGAGFSRFEGVAVTRWREDPVRDAWGSGIYLRDVGADRLWSAAYFPCRAEPDEQLVTFELERATFLRRDGDVRTSMEVCVSPEADAEVRRITIANLGAEEKVIEVTTFAELSLASPIADDAHPAFSKLFVRTAYDEASGCLVASRRPREAKDRTLWAAHALTVDGPTLGPPEYETDRAAFVGRGRGLAEPQEIRSRLGGKTGSVADPAFAMRRRVKLAPGDSVSLLSVLSVAETKDAAVTAAARLAAGQEADRSFRMAWNRTRIELRNLNLTHKEAALFQRFAGQVLYTPPLRGERADSIARNEKGQSGLWAFGVSGDRPIALVHIDNRSQLPFLVKLLTGHEYLRRLGLPFDLVVLNESAGGYAQDLQEALQRLVENGVDRFGAGAAGIHVIPANTLSDANRTLLLAAARIALKAGGASLPAQLRAPADAGEGPPPLAVAPAPPAEQSGTAAAAEPAAVDDLQFFNGWGGFAPDGKSYRIVLRHGNPLPAPWINVLANPRFGCFVSELGTGYTWWRNSRECKLTPWSNDPVLDPPGEAAYLRDEETGAFWTAAPAGASDAPPYTIEHGRGYSRFEHARHGVRHELTVFVPLDDPIKIMRVKVKNESNAPRQLSLTYYAEWVLGVQRAANAPYVVTAWDAEAGVLTARNAYQETFREATAFLGVFAPGTAAGGASADGASADGAAEAEEAALSWTADQLEFIGRNRGAERPAALERERLSGRTGARHASCGAVQRKFRLAPGEETELYVLLGCESSAARAGGLAAKYRDAGVCERAFEEARAFWDRTLEQTQVSTPSPEMNLMLNGWLLYQTIACRMWARTAFYQAGGAYGFRDQLQDSLAVLHTMPELTRAQTLIHAAHQYVEGDVQHWWHEETERGIRTLFSDDLLWLPYVVSRYVEHTGDASLFEEVVPYLTSEPLKEGEHERYEETRRSDETGTVYDHCVRAIDKALQRIGEHGLPLIGVGDWNDGLNLVGADGRGESVWLGWFLCEVLERFERLAAERGEGERAASYRAARERFAAALHEHGWDGQWYRRAFTDAGAWLGSIESPECRIDAIAQSWSVISGAAPRERAMQAMTSFDRELVDRDLAVVRLLTPAFDRTEPSPGYIQGYPPGIRENGAQYTHGVLWSIMAWAQLGKGDKAFELFHMLNPINHTRTEQEVRRYVGEPYAVAADVYTAAPHEGHAGWTWYTGASGWMYQVGLEWILGIRRRAGRLYVDPRIPADWPGFEARYRFGGAVYEIVVRRTDQGAESGDAAKQRQRRLTLDGEPVDAEEAPYVELRDDGRTHRVELML